ncbi:UNVERIFIED_CONTAM: hypothetical protein ABID98_000277 [Brevibacillus sp. OAP136]
MSRQQRFSGQNNGKKGKAAGHMVSLAAWFWQEELKTELPQRM